MALSKTTTAALIITNLNSDRVGRGLPAMSPSEQAIAVTYWESIMDAIYTRIKADMVITAIVQAAIPGVVTSGVGAGGATVTNATGTALVSGGTGSIT